MEIKIDATTESLTLSVSKEEAEELNTTINEVHELSRILEDCWSNGQYYVFSGDQLGHMTEAPMIVDEAEIDDDGVWTVHGRAWWFPDYCVDNCIEILKNTGTVTFPLGYRED